MTRRGIEKELSEIPNGAEVHVVVGDSPEWLRVVSVGEEYDPAGERHGIIFAYPANLPSGSLTGVPGFLSAASAPDGSIVADAAVNQSDPQIGNPGEESPAARALRWELVAGNYRRELDGLRSELRRLEGDRLPEPDEYPDDLQGVAEKLRYLYDRL